MFAILKGDFKGFTHWLGVQCATWVSTSRGSTGRSLANPHGLEDVPCVLTANALASRQVWNCFEKQTWWYFVSPGRSPMMFWIFWAKRNSNPPFFGRVAPLCILTVALRGTWIIEQPRSSLLMQHRRMQQLLDMFKAEHLTFYDFLWSFQGTCSKRNDHSLFKALPGIPLLFLNWFLSV